MIYATSKSFMDYFGINSADDLPKIKEVLADQAIEPTYLNKDNEEAGSKLLQETATEIIPEEDTAAFLAVTPSGELITAVEEAPAAGEQQRSKNETGHDVPDNSGETEDTNEHSR